MCNDCGLMTCMPLNLQAKQANGAYHPPKAGGKGQKQGEGGGHHHSHSDKQVLTGKQTACLLQSA